MLKKCMYTILHLLQLDMLKCQKTLNKRMQKQIEQTICSNYCKIRLIIVSIMIVPYKSKNQWLHSAANLTVKLNRNWYNLPMHDGNGSVKGTKEIYKKIHEKKRSLCDRAWNQLWNTVVFISWWPFFNSPVVHTSIFDQYWSGDWRDGVGWCQARDP